MFMIKTYKAYKLTKKIIYNFCNSDGNSGLVVSEKQLSLSKLALGASTARKHSIKQILSKHSTSK